MLNSVSPAVPWLQSVAFGGLRIGFDDRVLRPRAWTRAQSEWAASLLDDVPPGPVLELCAGVGHIGLAALAGSTRPLVMVDVDPAACRWARLNADAARPSHSVEVREADLAEALHDDEMFPMIIADPPWVVSATVGSFPEDPRIAIDGGTDGLGVARPCLDNVDRHLAPGGAAVLKLGSAAQVASAARYLAKLGISLVIDEVRHFDRGVLALLRWGSKC